MKICFISGPKKPTKCGVTDYVYLLGSKLKSLGNIVTTIHLKNSEDYLLLKEKLPSADLYSLQFSPYAFSQSGIPGKHFKKLANSLKSKKTQINFHEIWIGAYPNARWTEKIIGWVQKREIIKFLSTINSRIITTSNSAALDRLGREGIDAKYLYLSGSIPNFSFQSKNRKKHLQVIFFGSLYSKFPYQILFERLTRISISSERKIEIKIIGIQRENSSFKKIFALSKKHNFSLSKTGELKPEQVSQEFKFSSIAISTTPYDVIGKSSATVAMLEHGLPVLVYNDGDTPEESLFILDQFKDQIFLLNDPFSDKKLLHFLNKNPKPFFDGVAYTAKKMLEICH